MHPGPVLRLSLMMLVALVACKDDDAPRPATVFATPTPHGSRPLSSREPATPVTPVTLPPAASAPPATALPPGLPDPSEPGISDLARLARYIFREMQMADAECPFSNPLHGPLSFLLHVEVRDGRMREVHVARAGTLVEQQVQALSTMPPELQAYVACLAPRLEAVPMDPAPADGVYQPEYSYPGHRGP